LIPSIRTRSPYIDLTIESAVYHKIAPCLEPYLLLVERADRLARDLMVSEVLLAEFRKLNAADAIAARLNEMEVPTRSGRAWVGGAVCGIVKRA
jgi:hypothetical protein